jgi:hypothetical protein
MIDIIPLSIFGLVFIGLGVLFYKLTKSPK